MSSDTQPESTPKWMVVLGWIITVLPAALFLFSACGKFGWVEMPKPPEGAPDMGWRGDSFLGLAFVEIGGVALMLFPRTALFGAIVLTGYLGGAIATHVRIGDAFVFPQLLAGILIWFGLLLRDERLRAMLPWRGDPSMPPAGGFLVAVGKILLAMLLIIATIFGIASAFSTEYKVSRSISINAPASDIFPHVHDFDKWKTWIPFLDSDPDAKITIEGKSGVGAVYTWDGKSEGKMTLSETDLNKRVKVKLEFIRPFKEDANAEFTFKADGNTTVVTWAIVGERIFLTKMMNAGVSMDQMTGPMFELGLQRMKSVAEGKK